jgi:hypothetical protein
MPDQRAIGNAVFSAILRYYGRDEADSDDQEDTNELTALIMTEIAPYLDDERDPTPPEATCPSSPNQ